MFWIIQIATIIVKDPNAKSKKMVNLSHPHGISARKIIIDGYHMDALSRNRVGVCGKRGYQCFTFTGFHLRNIPLMKNYSAQKLNVIVALSQGATRGLTHARKRFCEHWFQ